MKGLQTESFMSVESMKGREKPGQNCLGFYTMEGGTGYSSLQKKPHSNLHGFFLFLRTGSGIQELIGQKEFQHTHLHFLHSLWFFPLTN